MQYPTIPKMHTIPQASHRYVGASPSYLANHPGKTGELFRQTHHLGQHFSSFLPVLNGSQQGFSIPVHHRSTR